MQKTARWQYVAAFAVLGLIVVRGCSDSAAPPDVIYTDECHVNYANGNQSGMEDCDLAVSQASTSPGATVQQLLDYPDGTGKWVAPTGDWG